MTNNYSVIVAQPMTRVWCVELEADDEDHARIKALDFSDNRQPDSMISHSEKEVSDVTLIDGKGF
jgi:hypothetical protein